MSYLNCWPHIRPWHIRNPEPALRCIPDAARVAGLIAEAAESAVFKSTSSETGSTTADA